MQRAFRVTGVREDFVRARDLKAFVAGKNISLTVAKDRLVKMGAWEDANCYVQGVAHGRGYMGVKRVGDGGMGADDDDDTSSASERRFRAALEEETGRTYAKARPTWLVNPATGWLMELDMYDVERMQAVEYDGPQHYKYPNGVHSSREEYEQQVERDRVKDNACRAHGVNLVRVRAGASVWEEMARSGGPRHREG